MRSPRRIAMLVLVFALLGAATTVAVAWGFAIRGYIWDTDPRTQVSAMVLDERAAIMIEAPAVRFGCTAQWSWIWYIKSTTADAVTVHVEYARSTYPRIYESPDSRTLPDHSTTSRGEYSFGWPTRAMRTTKCSQGQSKGWWEDACWVNGASNSPFIPFSRDAESPRSYALPIGILSRGFAMNTAFYAAAWWVLVFGLARGRAWNRRRRGLCVKCTYDLRGLEAHTPCPECGRIRTRS